MSFPTFRTAVAATHSWVGSSFTREDTRGVLGATVRRWKGAGLQRVRLHCPPVCARFLLGGTCDEVLAVNSSHASHSTGEITIVAEFSK
jgi:hypothetical protein